MKKATYYVVAAIGGLIFGFDTAIVAGATGYMKEQFSLNSLQEGWAVSVVLIGCMFGNWGHPISSRDNPIKRILHRGKSGGVPVSRSCLEWSASRLPVGCVVVVGPCSDTET